MKRWLGEGPFTFDTKDGPVTDRHGNVRTQNHLSPVLVPVCSEIDNPKSSCNNWLNRRYEQPAKDLVRRVLDDDGPLEGDEVVRFAEWWVKSLLLLHHRLARSEFPDVELSHWDLSDELYRSWRTTEMFPADLSLWIAVADPTMKRARLSRLSSPGRLIIPTTERADGNGGKPFAGTTGFAMSSGSAILVTQIALHPLVDLDHPFEAAGLATRVWPDPPATLAVGRLRRLDGVGDSQFGHVFTTFGSEFEATVSLVEKLPGGERRPADPIKVERLRAMLRSELPTSVAELGTDERLRVAPSDSSEPSDLLPLAQTALQKIEALERLTE